MQINTLIHQVSFLLTITGPDILYVVNKQTNRYVHHHKSFGNPVPQFDLHNEEVPVWRQCASMWGSLRSYSIPIEGVFSHAWSRCVHYVSVPYSPFSGFYIGEELYIADNRMQTTNK